MPAQTLPAVKAALPRRLVERQLLHRVRQTALDRGAQIFELLQHRRPRIHRILPAQRVIARFTRVVRVAVEDLLRLVLKRIIGVVRPHVVDQRLLLDGEVQPGHAGLHAGLAQLFRRLPDLRAEIRRRRLLGEIVLRRAGLRRDVGNRRIGDGRAAMSILAALPKGYRCSFMRIELATNTMI